MFKKTGGKSGGFFVSRASHKGRGVFVEVLGPDGGEIKVLDRATYKKAASRAGRELRHSMNQDRAKSVA